MPDCRPIGTDLSTGRGLPDGSGAPVFHVHGVVTDADGKAWGGHFFKGGNPVHATVDIVMNEIKGGYMKWTQDDEIDLELPVPYSK